MFRIRPIVAETQLGAESWETGVALDRLVTVEQDVQSIVAGHQATAGFEEMRKRRLFDDLKHTACGTLGLCVCFDQDPEVNGARLTNLSLHSLDK